MTEEKEAGNAAGNEEEEFSQSASDFLGSSYINGQNIQEIGIIGIREIESVTPKNVSKEGYPTELKLALGFKDFKGNILALNKTNGKILTTAFGDKYKEWIGNKVEIYVEKVKWQGKEVDGVKIRIPEE